MLYKVSVGTGTVWVHQETVEAFSEQEAVDAVADNLIGTAFVATLEELQKLCEPDETPDEYAEANNLVCCGNYGVYMEVVGIEKIKK